MTEEKIKGKVKWYSIRKGFGFITPTANAPTEDDIFFHQTAIVAGDHKNPFLETDYEVEFEVYTDDAGKYKSKNVTKPGGDPCDIPERKPSTGRRRGKGGADGEEGDDAKKDGDAAKDEKNEEGEKKENGRGRGRGKGNAADSDKKDGEEKKPAGRGGRQPRKRFDDGISVDVKNKMKEKKLDMRQTSLLLVLENNRLKFGPDGYAALCNADGIMAEGSFACDDEGKVTMTWKNMLKFADGAWKPEDPIANTSSGVLVGSFNWMDEKVGGLKQIETPESLWGEGKTDPADALESNNFLMKKCFLIKTPANPRNRRRPRPRGKKGGNNGKTENGDANGKTEAAEKTAEVKTEAAAS